MEKKFNDIYNYLLTNKVLDFISSIPIIKNITKEVDYENNVVKNGISRFINFMFTLFNIIIKFVFYYFISFIFSEVLIDINVKYNTLFILALFMFSNIIVFVLKPICEFDNNDYLIIRQLKFNKSTYYKIKILDTLKKDFIYTFLSLFLVFELIGESLITTIFYTFITTLGSISLKTIYEYIYLVYLKKKHKIDIKSRMAKFAYFSILLYLYIKIVEWISSIFKSLVINKYFALVLIIIIVFTALRVLYILIKKFDFNILASKYLTSELYQLRKNGVYYQSVNNKIKEVINKSEKKGYNYLFYLFNKKVLWTLITQFSLYIGLIIFYCFESYQLLFDINNSNGDPLFYLDILIKVIGIIMLVISMKNTYLKLIYSKLDKYLNKYAFYRKDVNTRVKLTLKTTSVYDLIVFVIFSISTFIFFKGYENYILTSFGYIIALSLLNCLVPIYLYYYFNKNDGDRTKYLKFFNALKVVIVIIMIIRFQISDLLFIIIFALIDIIVIGLLIYEYRKHKINLKY